jgi:hypothetical protein
MTFVNIYTLLRSPLAISKIQIIISAQAKIVFENIALTDFAQADLHRQTYGTL